MFEVKLGFQAILNNKKRTLSTLGLISLLITVIIFANVLIYTNRASKDLQLELIYGSWTHAFFEESRFSSFDAVGTYYIVADSLGSFDNTMFELHDLNTIVAVNQRLRMKSLLHWMLSMILDYHMI